MSVSGSRHETDGWPRVSWPVVLPRLFFWLLSASLLATGVLGLVDGDRVADALRDEGVGPVLVDAITDASRRSETMSFTLLIVGSLLVLWTGYTGIKALVLVHATVWGIPPKRLGSPVRASLVFNGAVIGFIASMGVVRWLRTEAEVLGLILTLLLIVVPFMLWLMASRRLPHRGVDWLDVVPGAIVVAVGQGQPSED
jgi:uncharacterized BrkB/YihY/UPF0761 family membrane protein